MTAVSIKELHAQLEEKLVRDLLGRWVSELPPMIVRDTNGVILGLTLARDMGVGEIVPIYVRREWTYARNF